MSPDIPLSLLAPKHNRNLSLSGNEPGLLKGKWNHDFNQTQKATGLNLETLESLIPKEIARGCYEKQAAARPACWNNL